METKRNKPFIWYFIKYGIIIIIIFSSLYIFQNTGYQVNKKINNQAKNFRVGKNLLNYIKNSKEEDDDDKEHSHVCRRISEFKGDKCKFLNRHCDDSVNNNKIKFKRMVGFHILQ